MVGQILLIIHITAGILFIGPAAVASSLFGGYAPISDPDTSKDRRVRSGSVARLLHRICRVYGVLALIVPAAGIVLGLLGDRFTEGWLLAATVLTAVAGVVFAVRIVPAQAAALATPVTRKRITRMGGWAGLFNLLWIVVLILMVIQPGGGR